MKIIHTSIKRPVFIFMMFCSLIVLGSLGYYRLPVDLYPDVEIPVILISVPYPGAVSEEVENAVVKHVEDAISPISGIDKVVSICNEGLATIKVEFDLGTDLKDAELKIRSNIQSIRNILPKDIEEPIFRQIDFSAIPVVLFSAYGHKDMPINKLRYYADEIIKRELQKVNGVADVHVIGGQEREIHVITTKSQLDNMGISITQLAKAIRNNNINVPAGVLNKSTIDIPIRTVGEFSSVDDLNNVVIDYTSDGSPIKLHQVAKVKDDFKEKRTISRINGEPAILITVQKQSKTNFVEVANNVIDKAKEINEKMPSKTGIKPIIDMSRFVKQSISSVEEALLIGAILAVLIVFCFLLNWRSTIVTAFALPNSIIGTFFLLYLFGFTQNILTMLALALAVGLLIDEIFYYMS